MGPVLEPRLPACRRKPARRWQGLEDRPCMPIYWGSNTHPWANTSSSARNCQMTLAVYGPVSMPSPGCQGVWADLGKLSQNQRLDDRRKGHADVTGRDLGVSFFRPLFSCNV